MTRFHRLIRLLHAIEDIVLVVLFVALMGLAFAQIGLRNLAGGGWPWADSASRVLVLWLALWGASIAGRHGKHIRIELAIHYFPAAWQRSLLVLCDFACAVISGIVAWHSTNFVTTEYSYHQNAFLNLPSWVCEVVIPFSFALLALRFLAQAVANAFHAEKEIE